MGSDFENVAHIALVVLIPVILMYTMSALLCRRLIGIENERIIRRIHRTILHVKKTQGT